jgi:multidrug efflux pump subunit AcrA (membrane-fusion protein)
MFVKVGIDISSSRVLTLPQSAVQRKEGITFVLVQRGKDEYQRRTIKTGAEFDGLVEVLEGVTPADRVVTAGGILLKQRAQ